MSPNLFHSLSKIRGFNDLNGKTYIDHILLIFNDILTRYQKDQLQNYENELDALNFLRNQMITFTHNYETV